jgi:hypothetical protein
MLPPPVTAIPAPGTPRVPGNTGPLPFIPAVYATNTFGADLRALGAKSLTIDGAAKLRLTFADNGAQAQAMNVLSETLGGATLLSDAERVYRCIPDLSGDAAAKFIEGAHLQGVNGVQLLEKQDAPGGFLNLYVQPGWAEHLNELLRDTIGGFKINLVEAMNEQGGSMNKGPVFQLPSPDAPVQ